MRGIPCAFDCGDRVYCKVDPRHVGTIVQINSGIWASIRWDETNFYSEEVKVSSLKRYETEHDEAKAGAGGATA